MKWKVWLSLKHLRDMHIFMPMTDSSHINSFTHSLYSFQSVDQVLCSSYSMAALQSALSWSAFWYHANCRPDLRISFFTVACIMWELSIGPYDSIGQFLFTNVYAPAHDTFMPCNVSLVLRIIVWVWHTRLSPCWWQPMAWKIKSSCFLGPCGTKANTKSLAVPILPLGPRNA